MQDYVYPDNQKIFPKSRVNYVKIIIVIELGWWDYGYILFSIFQIFCNIY